MKKYLVLGLVLTLVLAMAVGCTSNSNGGNYEDGTFTAEGEIDDRGWTPVVEVVVENGEIVSVNYVEYNEEGQLKSEDDDYAEAMKGVAGVSPAEAYEQLENDLISSQDVNQVELVSGATGSSELFKELVTDALNQ